MNNEPITKITELVRKKNNVQLLNSRLFQAGCKAAFRGYGITKLDYRVLLTYDPEFSTLKINLRIC